MDDAVHVQIQVVKLLLVWVRLRRVYRDILAVNVLQRTAPRAGDVRRVGAQGEVEGMSCRAIRTRAESQEKAVVIACASLPVGTPQPHRRRTLGTCGSATDRMMALPVSVHESRKAGASNLCVCVLGRGRDGLRERECVCVSGTRTQTHTQTHTDTHRHAHRHRDRDTQTQGQRQTHLHHQVAP